MPRAYTNDMNSVGFLTLEAMIGLSAMMAVFLVCFHLAVTMWLQLRAEDSASMLVREATRIPHPPGTRLEQPFVNRRGSVRLNWGRDHVWVQVRLEGDRAIAERILPREAW